MGGPNVTCSTPYSWHGCSLCRRPHFCPPSSICWSGSFEVVSVCSFHNLDAPLPGCEPHLKCLEEPSFPREKYEGEQGDHYHLGCGCRRRRCAVVARAPVVHGIRKLCEVAGRCRPARGGSSLCHLHSTVHTRQRDYGGRWNSFWPEDRILRCRRGRQPRCALLVLAGAQLPARKSCQLGGGESKVSPA